MKFDVEILEPRLLLSADGVSVDAASVPEVDVPAVSEIRESAPERGEDSTLAVAFSDSSGDAGGLFGGMDDVDFSAPAPDVRIDQQGLVEPHPELNEVVLDESPDQLPPAGSGDLISIAREQVVSLTAARPPPPGSVTLNSDVITAGLDLLYEGDVSIGVGQDILISSGDSVGGDITIEGNLNGLPDLGMATESLRIEAGTGDVIINGDIGLTTPLQSLTILSAGRVTLNGHINVTGAFTIMSSIAPVNIGLPLIGQAPGDLTAGSITVSTSSSMTFHGNVESLGYDELMLPVPGDISLHAPSDGNIEFKENTLSSAGLNISNAGNVRFNGTVTVADDLVQTTGGGSTRFDDSLQADAIDLTTQSLIFDGQAIVTNGSMLALAADEIDFNGPADSITTTALTGDTQSSVISVRPVTPGVPVKIGTASGTELSVLDLTKTELATISDRFLSMAIGDVGSGDLTVGISAFKNPLSLQGTNILVSGQMTVPGSLSLDAQTGDVEVNQGSVEVTDIPGTLSVQAFDDILLTEGDLLAPASIQLTTLNGEISQPDGVGLITTDVLTVDSAGSVDLNTNVNTLDGTIAGTGDLSITEQDTLSISDISTMDGGISIIVLDGSIIIMDPGTGISSGGTGSIHLEARKVLASEADVVVDQQVSANNGAITILAADDVTQSADGDVTISNGSENVSVSALAGSVSMNAAAVTTVDVGSISYAAQLDVDVARLAASETAADSNVTIHSQSGKVVDVNGAAVNVVGDLLTIDAADGIDLDSTVTRADVASLLSGDVLLQETDAIQLTDVSTADGTITVLAAGLVTALQVDSSTTDDGSNTIHLESSAAGILAGVITAGALNPVELDAAGPITNDGNPDTRITANLFTAFSLGAMDVDTAVVSIDAMAGQPGSILIKELDDILLNQVRTADGPISVVADGQIIAAHVTSSAIDNDLNDISMRSNGSGIEVQFVEAGAMNDLSLFAANGSISQDGDPAVDVIADQLLVESLGGSDLDTMIRTLDLVTAGSGSVQIDESDDLDILQLITADGPITVDAGGELIARIVDSSANGAHENDIDLASANSRILVGRVNAGPMNDATFTALNQSVEQDGDPDVDVLADRLVIEAGTHVDLDTQVATAIVSSLVGDILLNESDAIDLVDLDAENGAISVLAVGQITATNVDSTKTLDGTNTILLRSTNAGIEVGLINGQARDDLANDVTLDAQGGPITQDGDNLVDVYANHLLLDAFGGINLDTRITTLNASTHAAGNIQIAELNDIELTDVDTIDGSVSVSAGRSIIAVDVDTSLTPADGDVSLMAARGVGATIAVHFINAGTQNNVTLEAQGDAVSQDGDAAVDVVAAHLMVDAAGDIDLDTTVETADLSTHASGNILIDETDAIRLVDVDTDDGMIEVTASGQIFATDVNSGNTSDPVNTISLSSLLAGIEVDLVVASPVADVILDAQAGGITQDGDAESDLVGQDLQATATAGIDLDTSIDTVIAHAGANIRLDESDAIDLTEVITTDGFITVDAAGQIIARFVASDTVDNDLNDIQIASSAAGIEVHLIQAGLENDLVLSAGAGAITQDGDGATDVVADKLTADAVSGIDLDTALTLVMAHVSGEGHVLLNEVNEIILEDVTTANGLVTVEAVGRITATHVNSASVDSGDNDIFLTSTAADIQVDLIVAGNQNDVFLDARGGAISQDGDADVDLVGDQLVADAQGEILLDTTLARLDASTSGTGNILINETDGIDLEEVDTLDGSITVTSGDDLVARDVDSSSTDDGSNPILLTSGGGILVHSINGGISNDVTMVANGGGISQDGDVDVDVRADTLVATAAGAIDLDTTIRVLDATTTGDGDLRVMETDEIILREIHVANGQVNVRAAGQITALDVQTTQVADALNDVFLTSTTAGILVDFIDASAGNDVTLDAQAGGITQDGDPETDVTAKVLTLTAMGEINLDTQVEELEAGAIAPGDLTINETDAIVLTNINVLDGTISIDAGGDATAQLVHSDRGPINLNAGGFLQADDVNTGDGSITLRAGGQLTATHVDSSARDNDTNDIFLTSTGSSIEVGDVNAGEQNDVTLDAQGGAIVDDGNPATRLTADFLTADALGGIELDTAVARVDASTDAIGEIVLREVDDLELTDVDTLAGAILVTAEGQITAVDVDSSARDNDFNDITLVSNGAGIEVGSVVAGQMNDVNLDALGGGITQGVGAGVTADVLTAFAAGDITLDTTVDSVVATTAADGTITLNETDAITLTQVASLNGPVEVTAGGQITATEVRTDGNDDPANTIALTSTGAGIELGLVVAGSSADVTLDAPGGAITEDGDEAADVSGQELVATAATGIDLDTAVDAVIAQVSGAGDIVLDEADALVLTDLDTVDGAITVVAGGPVTAVDVDSSATGNDTNDIRISSTGAGIEVQSVKAGSVNDVFLDAGAGAITQGPGTGVSGDVLTASAAGAITLSTTVDSVVATTSAPGDIHLMETDDVILSDVHTADGSITVVAEGQVTVIAADSSGSTGEHNDLILVSKGAGIQVTGEAAAGDDVLLMADGMTAGIAIDGPVRAADRITLLSEAGIMQHDMLAAGESVELLARGGAIVMDAMGVTMSPVIRYHAVGDVTLGLLDTRTAADQAAGTILDQSNWGQVSVKSTEGNIVTALAPAVPSVFAGELNLQTPQGDVGLLPGQALIAEVARLAALTGGVLHLYDPTELEVGTVSGLMFERLLVFGISVPVRIPGAAGVRGGGPIILGSASGRLVVNAALESDGATLLLTTAPGMDVVIDAPVRMQSGDLSIRSAGDILQSATISSREPGSGHTIDLQAANGSILLTPEAVIQSAGGTVKIEAQARVELGQVDTRTLLDQVLNTLDDQSNWGDIGLSAGEALMEPSGGTRELFIARSLSVELSGDRLGAEAGGVVTPIPVELETFASTGALHVGVADASGLAVGTTDAVAVQRVQPDGSLDPRPVGGVSGLTGAETVQLSAAAGDLVVDVAFVAGGVIQLETPGRILINASVRSTSSHLTVKAGGDVIQSADLVSEGGTLFVQSRDGSVTMSDGARALTDGGNIRYASRGDVILEWLDARSPADRDAGSATDQANWGQVSVVSFAGSILDGDPAGDSDVDISASAVRFTAAGPIGVYGLQANPIEVDVLEASAEGPRGINVVGEYTPEVVDPVLVQEVTLAGLMPVQDDATSRYFTQIESDFDGDGVADVYVFSSETGEWTIRYSSTGEVINFVWGSGGDAYAVRGDLNRDGKADPIVYQRTFVDKIELLAGELEAILVDPDVLPFFQQRFDFESDVQDGLVVMLGDVSGDGASDMIGYNPENGLWTTIDTVTGFTQSYSLGVLNAQAVTGDFDGDGLTDIGHYVGGVFTARLTGTGSIISDTEVGGAGWVAVIADYSGDGIDDFTAYNPATGAWEYRDRTTNTLEVVNWMGPGLLPTSGDYDGDGTSDIVAFDADTGAWFIRSSQSAGLLLLDPGDPLRSFILGSLTELPVNDA